MNSVDKYFIEKFNSNSKSHKDKNFSKWENDYSISVAKRFLSLNKSGRMAKRGNSVVWNNVASWGMLLDKIVVKDRVLVHFKPKEHGDVAFVKFDVSKLLDNNRSLSEKLSKLNTISSSITVNRTMISVGCDFPGAILVSINVAIRFLVGLDSLTQAREKYPKLIMLVKKEDNENFLKSGTLSEAISKELMSIGKKYGSPARFEDISSVLYKGESRYVYTYNRKLFGDNVDDNDITDDEFMDDDLGDGEEEKEEEEEKKELGVEDALDEMFGRFERKKPKKKESSEKNTKSNVDDFLKSLE